MLYDLWGRGFTDSPLNAPHDARLFNFQIYAALTSSAISWTGEGSGGFSIVAFSMGGGIAMDFASHCPYLINDMVLLGPAGLFTAWPGPYGAFKFQYGKYLPSGYMRREVAKLLGYSGGSSIAVADADKEGKNVFDVPGSVAQQIEYHQGFLRSFLDTIAHAPIVGQHETWRKVFAGMGKGKGPKRVLIVFGRKDDVVKGVEITGELESMREAQGRYEVHWVDGDHGFAHTKADQVLERLYAFWGLEA